MHTEESQPRPLGAAFCDVPVRLRALILCVDAGAIALAAVMVARDHPTAVTWRYATVLLVLAVLFEETSRRIGRMRLLVGGDGALQDMTSVWTFAGALILPAGYAALFAAVIAVHAWLRQQRDVGQLLYRRIYTAATVMLACMAAGPLVAVDLQWDTGLLSLASLLRVLGALLIYTAVNRLLISAAIVLTGAPPSARALIGTWDDNGLEFATLCLGFMTAVVVVGQPLLGVIVLLPVVLLQRAALVKQLETAASTDAKTQLLNPLAWRQRAQRELELSRVGHIALLVLDLDYFKAVNDLHGHLVGDAALLATSVRITGELRTGDIVGRFGGEEFVVLLPGLNAEGAMAVADRLRLRIGGVRLCDLGATHQDDSPCEHTLSTSIGVAVFPDNGAGLTALLAEADKALYAAKDAGRNTVVLAEPRPSSASGEERVG
jgi:diguanylate cyclase (GGDEF)-like protein